MKNGCPAEARSTGLCLPLCGLEVPVIVQRSRKRGRNLAIGVRHHQGIVVRVPYGFPLERLPAVLAEHRPWLERQVAGMVEAGGHPAPRRIQEGDPFSYLGERFCLRLEAGAKDRVRLEQETLAVRMCARSDDGDISRLPNLLEQWYRARAREAINERLPRHAARMGLAPPPFRITGARGRWGSCGRNSLNFSWRLVMASPELIDYVVVHELCHLKQRDHSPAFWRLVEEFIPDWRQRRAALRQVGGYCLP